MLEKPQEHRKQDGKDDNHELRNIAARFNRMDATLQLEQDTRSLETVRLESQAAEEAKDEEAAKSELIIGQKAKHADGGTHFHPQAFSSNFDTYIQTQFHPMTFSPNNVFIHENQMWKSIQSVFV